MHKASVSKTDHSKNKLASIIRWILGGFFLVIGILLISVGLLPSLLLLVVGLLVTPLSDKHIFGKLKFVVPTWVKFALCAILLLAVFGALPASDIQPRTDLQQNSQSIFATKEVTEDTVRSEIEGVRESGYRIELDDISKIDVIKQVKEAENLSETYAINVFYTFEAWDNEDVMKIAAASSVELFERLFSHPQIVRVATFAEQDFTDQYGKTNTTTAVKFIMDRDTASKIDWNGVKDTVLIDYKALFPLTDYTIHAAIGKDLK